MPCRRARAILAAMPVLTLGQLSKALATGSPSNQSTFFMEPGGTLLNYVNEMGPRVYALGMWRELLTTREYPGADGYFSLDRDIETPVHAVVNNRPQKVNAQFHDMRFYGNTTFLPERYGLVDMGFHTEKRDIQTIQDVDDYADIVPVTELFLTERDGTAVAYADLTAAGSVFTITGYDADGLLQTAGISDDGGDAVATFSTGIVRLNEIVATDVTKITQLRTDAADEAAVVTEIFPGTDVPRYRRFRVGGAMDETVVLILGKRAWSDLTLPTDLVWLGNTAAWKHALLTKVAEDTGEPEKATYHWGMVKSILDDELKQHQGPAVPVPAWNFNSGSYPIHNLY